MTQLTPMVFVVDDDDLAEARALLAGGAGVLELSPAAQLAWTQELEGIVVFANGESLVFPESVLPSIIALCAEWRLAGSDLDSALADQHSANLLDYLLESRRIYVE